ncbi:hypothetical protein TrRE_jg1553, partial [Triparma retinervis]
MEDEFFVSPSATFCAVFDGHGGSKVSKFLKEKLHKRYVKDLRRGMVAKGEAEGGEVEKVDDEDLKPTKDTAISALSSAFAHTNDEVMKVSRWSHQGSTAVVCLFHEDPLTSKSTIVTANVGDSRAVLSRDGKAVDLTVDHKPNDKRERERIKSLGGKVSWFGYRDKRGRPIPGSGVYRINGNLAVARAIGDKSESPFVSSLAEVLQLPSDPENDQFVVLASDGLWDVMSSQEAVTFVHEMMRGGVGALPQGGQRGQGTGTRPATLKISDWTTHHSDDRVIIRSALSKRKKFMAKFLVEEAMRRGSSDNTCV